MAPPKKKPAVSLTAREAYELGALLAIVLGNDDQWEDVLDLPALRRVARKLEATR